MPRSLIAYLAILLAALLLSSCGDDPARPDLPDPFDTNFSSEAELIQGLAVAYERQSLEIFELLFANNPECSAEYLFFLSDPSPNNEMQWGYSEEIRIHRRMFDPAHLAPDEPEVPAAFWLKGITITLTPTLAFAERSDLYLSEINPNGLDPRKWRVTDGLYATSAVFDMAGEIDFILEVPANFIVIEDLSKEPGTQKKFQIYRWEDLSVVNFATDRMSWGAIKGLFS